MIFNVTRREYLARNPRWALSWCERLRGMIGRRFVPGVLDAMVFEGCNAVHTLGMSFPIDLVFLDPRRRVVALRQKYPPWRLGCGSRRAVIVLELPEGEIDRSGTRIGDQININWSLDGETIEKLADTAMLNLGKIQESGS